MLKIMRFSASSHTGAIQYAFLGRSIGLLTQSTISRDMEEKTHILPSIIIFLRLCYDGQLLQEWSEPQLAEGQEPELLRT
jgi:hypothetical protein